MASVTVYNQAGEKAGDMQLADALFAVAPNPAVVHEIVVAQQANARVAIAHTKDRSDVRGGGRKPWKQKGTGRARHGSRRSPIWSGGGVTFGPRSNRNFSKKVNKKTKRQALAMVLTDKLVHDQLVVVDSLEMKELKTKNANTLLSALPHAQKKTILLLDGSEKDMARTVRNLTRVATAPATSLNIVDLLGSERVVVSKQGVEALTKVYTESAE